jgi:hypothetical protein
LTAPNRGQLKWSGDSGWDLTWLRNPCAYSNLGQYGHFFFSPTPQIMVTGDNCVEPCFPLKNFLIDNWLDMAQGRFAKYVLWCKHNPGAEKMARPDKLRTGGSINSFFTTPNPQHGHLRQTSWWNDLQHPTTNSKHYTRLMTVKDSGRPSLDTSVLFTSTVTEGSQSSLTCHQVPTTRQTSWWYDMRIDLTDWIWWTISNNCNMKSIWFHIMSWK